MSSSRRLSITFPEELISKIDEYAKSMNLTRTSAMIVLCNTSLQQNDTIKVMSDMLSALPNDKDK